VQKALKTHRITALPDGTIDPEIADKVWNAAAEVRPMPDKVPADLTRVVSAGSLATAEATVRAVLVEHGAPANEMLTLADVRLAGELLRVQQRSNAISRQEQEHRMRLRRLADEAVDKRIVDALVSNTIRVIWRFVRPDDVPTALDTLRELLAHCL